MSAGAEDTQAHPAPDRPTTSPQASAPAAARWLARAAFLAALAAAVVLVGFALNGGVRLLLFTALGVVVVIGSAWWFLSVRGAVRWLALALVVLTPVVLAWLFIPGRPAVGSTGGARADGGRGRGRAGRAPAGGPPERHAGVRRATPAAPVPGDEPAVGRREGGRFGLKEKAEALGAEVALLEGPGTVDVAALARDAVARGADLLGVAGGDGTQALVAGIAAEHDLPFLVISAGTRNHFALDLGLDRERPGHMPGRPYRRVWSCGSTSG